MFIPISHMRCFKKAMDARRGANGYSIRKLRNATGFIEMARFLEATLRDGGDLGALLCYKLLVVGGTTARLAPRMATQIAPVANAKLV